MSRKEPSYYEIALTQRQVVVAFVIVLVCLLASFLLGVWVGQGGAPPPAVEQADATTGEGSAPEEDDGKLRFFTENGGGETTPSEPPESPADDAGEPTASSTTSLREDLDRGSVPVEPAPQPSRPAPRSRPEQTAPPQRTEPAQPVQPTPTRTNLPPGGEGFVVQVFSSPDQAQAQKVLDRLIQADQDAFLLPQEIEGQVMYRVRVGPFETRAEAERIAQRVERDLQLDTWVTQ